jgi:hypothetical protein
MALAALGSPRLNSGDEICSVLRHIQLASKHELKERIIAGIEMYRGPTSSPKLPGVIRTSKTMV